MFDLNHLPGRANVQFFPGVSGVAKVSEYVWHRPPGTTFAYVYGIGGGGGGGNGFTAAAGSARGGGGGGGSASPNRAFLMLDMIPSDVMFLMVGYGGPSVTAGGPTKVSFSLYSDAHTATTQGPLNAIFSNAGGAGGSGTGAAAGTAGASGAVSGLNPFTLLAISTTSQLGIAGGTGGVQTGAVGGSTGTSLGGGPAFGGTGGAGVGTANTDFAGGAMSGSILWGTQHGPPIVSAGGVAGGGRGQNGYVLLNKLGIPYFIAPATGGGSSGASGTGGAGGNGGYGGGGGGGGGGVTGGAGGLGGAGFVAIISF